VAYYEKYKGQDKVELIKGDSYDPLANFAGAVNSKDPKKKKQAKFEEDEGDDDDDTVPDDFDFDEFTEENHLSSIQDFAAFAKDHKGN
jgi:hypothetical protein